MKCQHCGNETAPDAKFCASCGAPAAARASTQTTPGKNSNRRILWPRIAYWVGVLTVATVAANHTTVSREAGPNEFVFVGIVAIAFLLWLSATHPAPMEGRRFCAQCHAVESPRFYDAGSGVIEFFLYCFFLIPGIFYHFWRQSKRYWGCPACGSGNIVPVQSPLALEHAAAVASPQEDPK